MTRGYILRMRALCVGRHPFLSEHLCRFFEAMGVDARPCVGLEEAANRARAESPDVVIADYDLLVSSPLEEWEQDAALSRVPIIAVSLTRDAGDSHLLDRNGIAGFLYLPTLEVEDGIRVLAAVRRAAAGVTPPPDLQWPGTTPVAQLR
jgi:DNA-binding NarL/FixJ family response regulator